MKLGNPGIFTLLGFGYSVAVLGVQQLLPYPELMGAAIYAIIVGVIAEFIGGMWCFARGETYIGSIASTFGAWLIGYFLMLTQGVTLKVFHPASGALFCFALIPPVVMLTVPAIKMRLRELMLAFVFLIGLLVFLGLANLPIAGGRTFQKIGGVFAILSAIVLWDLAWKAIKQMMDEMTRGQ
jgi:succinate-acetate transporter protein